MSELVPVSPTANSLAVMGDAYTLAERIARTDFVPAALKGKPEAVMACILTGHEVGIGAMQSLSKIHVIEGRPAMAAELMRALVLRDGHEIWFEDSSNTKVTICGQRAGSDKVTRVTWTMDDAKKANLDGRKNWRSFPRAMLIARATGELCRMMFADVLGGISYVKEELEDGDIFEPAPEDEPDAAATVTRQAAPPKKSAARKAAAAKKAAPLAEPPLPPLPGEEDATEDADVVTKRAQQIAMRAQQHGIDHHFVVEAVTCGQKTSAKAVTAEEGAEVLMAIRDIAAGRKAIVDTEHGRRLADVGSDDEPAEPEILDDGQGDEEPEESDAGSAALDEAEERRSDPGAAPEPPVPPAPPTPSAAPAAGDDWGSEGDWDGDRWRSYLKSQKVTVTDALREAQRLAREMGDDTHVPTRLDDIGANASLATLLRGFVDELVLEREGS